MFGLIDKWKVQISSTSTFVLALLCLSSVISGLYSFYYRWIELYTAAKFNFACCIVYLFLTIILSRISNQLISSLVLLLSINIQMAGISIFLIGSEGGAHYYFFIYGVGALILIPFDLTTLRYSLATLSVLLFAVVEYVTLNKYAIELLPSNNTLIMHTSSTVSSVLIILYIVNSSHKMMLASRSALDRELKIVDALLHNTLPKEVILQIRKTGTHKIAYKKMVSLMFADVVGFTNFCNSRNAEEIANFLTVIFNQFDALSKFYQIEKIKTIGDAYMAASGAPVENENHYIDIGNFALDLLKFAEQWPNLFNYDLGLRIGISTGEVLAGVIGTEKYSYDMWGPTVNFASRIESHSSKGVIMVSPNYYDIAKNHFYFSDYVNKEIRGFGIVKTRKMLGRSAENQLKSA